MSKDITTEILVKSGFKQNPDKTWIYEMTGTSNFNVVGFGRERSICVEESRKQTDRAIKILNDKGFGLIEVNQ